MKSSRVKIKIDKQRLEFVRYWVRYIKTHSSETWSLQQKMLIDSILLGADQNIDRYLRLKKLARKVHAHLRKKIKGNIRTFT